jgi:prophage regulatory protein
MINYSQTPITPVAIPDQLLRINDVAALTTLSKSCVNLWVAQGKFPKPIALSATLKVWRSSDLSDWIDMQFEGIEDSNTAEHSEVTPSPQKAKGKSK